MVPRKADKNRGSQVVLQFQQSIAIWFSKSFCDTPLAQFLNFCTQEMKKRKKKFLQKSFAYPKSEYQKLPLCLN